MELDETMYKIITEEWGIPDIAELKDRKIKFAFDSNELPEKDDKYCELCCKNGEVKFCLYDYENRNIIFTMDFFEPNNTRFSKLLNDGNYIILELLNVNDCAFRKKGIASYYIKKLQEYAIKKNFTYILVKPNANAENFKGQNKENALSQDQLEAFYKSKSTEEMPILFEHIKNS